MRYFALIRALLVIAAISSPSSFAAAEELRIATQVGPQYAPLFVAKRKGWVEQEIAKTGARPVLKWTSFPAGPPMNESFAAGQQDLGVLGDTPALIGRAAGIDTRIIGLTSSGPKTLAVIVPAASKISSPRDLKGKRVAVVKGSYAHHLLVLVLKKGGLSTKDIELINLSQADIATSILNGNIDAAATWDPLLSKLESQGLVRVVADGTGIKKGALVIIASGQFLGKKRDQAKALLRAYQRGAEFIKANPKEAARLVAADVNLPPDLLLKVLGKFDYHPAIRGEDVEELKRTESFIRQAGLIRTPVKVESFVDRDLAREAGIR